MNSFLVLACEGGRLVRFDTKTYEARVIYQHPTSERFMGLAWWHSKLYFGGESVVGILRFTGETAHVEKLETFFDKRRAKLWRYPRRMWTSIGAYSRAIEYASLQFHQMNIYGSALYVTVTERNEIWELALDLTLKRKIVVQPHIQDYHHVNNIYSDGKHFYVCFYRYAWPCGAGGYAKFDLEWNELERRTLGWESHALSVINGRVICLCNSSGAMREVSHSHRAGMSVDGEFVFEYDANKYYCKDFSMDDERIYVVGGEIKPRAERKNAAGIVFVLDRNYKLLHQSLLKAQGNISGCRLPDLDYSDGIRSS